MCVSVQVEFLKSSKHDAVAQVVLRLQPLQVTPGQYICHRGDIALEMYVPALLLHCLRNKSVLVMYSRPVHVLPGGLLRQARWRSLMKACPWGKTSS